MSWFHPTSVLDKVFEGGIIIKGVTGALEFLGGVLLFFVSPAQMHQFIALVTQRELLEDPNDKVANLLLNATSHLASGGRAFAIAYLWIHAVIKLVAVVGILRNQLWAYPFSLITLGVLMLYQTYSIFFVRASIGMIVLTVFDAFILWLIWREYGKVRGELPAQSAQA
ncbi:membrane protein [Intrasporangium oryzae NRRL B-24470]|uniref:Membrane protein n=1 Tax=Intrasporangium oryzae NRRL B-24470 TaxID=1386089 RepID=W9GBG8_9MICO|nr:DUF2127 domain-containing protein [Intrasporangium oryzae]EWT02562.1 membrane protein [Intrasporangium oryzae NRRL B-24470]